MRFSRVGHMLELQRAMWQSCAAVAGPGVATFASACLAARHATEIPGFVVRRIQERLR